MRGGEGNGKRGVQGRGKRRDYVPRPFSGSSDVCHVIRHHPLVRCMISSGGVVAAAKSRGWGTNWAHLNYPLAMPSPVVGRK